MKQEDKELLLKELSARLPYGVLVKTEDDYITTVDSIIIERPTILIGVQINGECKDYLVEDVLPYLRPMSSMTDEEKRDLGSILQRIEISSYDFISPLEVKLDWLLKHHFDFRGLIPKGLALEAPSDMYKFE